MAEFDELAVEGEDDGIDGDFDDDEDPGFDE